MGLEGTLRAFSVTDIVQVLGLQRKSGILTIEGEEDTITVSFMGGEIVSADSAARNLEERVGGLLVRSGKLPREQLARTFEEREETRQRLGLLLLRDRLVSPQDLREALRLEICRIILAAFRWTEGRFRFSQEGVVNDDAALLLPIPTDAVLMEALQVLEEWPKLELRFPSRDLVYRRAPGLENLRLVLSAEEAGDGALLVSRREAEAWRWVDGKSRVGEILERAFLSDLDVYRGLADLLDRNLITQARLQAAAIPRPPPRTVWVSARAIGLWALLLLLAALAVREVPRNPLNILLFPSRQKKEATDLLKSVSLGRLASIERAVRVYYDATGRYPRSLEDLLASGVLDREAAFDPYGRPYRYILRSEDGKFSLFGRNARGEIDLDLSFERSLAPESELRPAPRPKRSDRQPGVQVIQ